MTDETDIDLVDSIFSKSGKSLEQVIGKLELSSQMMSGPLTLSESDAKALQEVLDVSAQELQAARAEIERLNPPHKADYSRYIRGGNFMLTGVHGVEYHIGLGDLDLTDIKDNPNALQKLHALKSFLTDNLPPTQASKQASNQSKEG